MKSNDRTIKFTQIIERVLEILLYLSCLFPFTRWIPTLYTGTDSQPYALGVAFLAIGYYVLVKKERFVPKELVLLLFGVVLIGVYALTDAISLGIFYVAKKYVTYVSIIVIPLAVFDVMKSNRRVWEGLIKLSIWAWLIAGVVQKWIDSDFAAQFVIRQSTDAQRGVVSLSGEPSAYGYYCLFALLFVWGFQKQRLLYAGLLLIQILGLAQSTVAVIYLGIYAVGYALNELILHEKYAFVKYFSLLGGGILAVCLAYQKHWLPTRMYQIVNAFVAGDWDSLLLDGSIDKRISGITDSLSQLVHNFMLPQGFSGERYFSGNGILLVEGGIISAFILVIVAVMIGKAYPRKQQIMFVFGFLMVMFSAIPYSSPLAGLYLGYCCYLGYRAKEHKKEQQPEVSDGQVCAAEVLAYIGKRWKLLLPLALGLAVLSGFVRYYQDYRENLTEYRDAVDKANGINKERDKLIAKLSDEEYAEVMRCYDNWELAQELSDYLENMQQREDDSISEEEYTQVYNQKEEAETIANGYEGYLTYVQKKLCTLLINEYLNNKEKPDSLTTMEPIYEKPAWNMSYVLFGILMGFAAAVACVGAYGLFAGSARSKM